MFGNVRYEGFGIYCFIGFNVNKYTNVVEVF